MKTIKVVVVQTTTHVYKVRAEDVEEALEKVKRGDAGWPISTEYTAPLRFTV